MSYHNPEHHQIDLTLSFELPKGPRRLPDGSRRPDIEDLLLQYLRDTVIPRLGQGFKGSTEDHLAWHYHVIPPGY